MTMTAEEVYNKVASDNAQKEIEAFNQWCIDNGWGLKRGLYYKSTFIKTLPELYPSFKLQYTSPDTSIQAMEIYGKQQYNQALIDAEETDAFWSDHHEEELLSVAALHKLKKK